MNDVTAGPVAFFSQDHQDCDELWAAVESAVDNGDDAAAAAAWGAFERAMQAHFRMEEDVLFPAFESATGMRGGPTHVMRTEHAQMRGVLEEMANKANEKDFEGLADCGDTLLMLIQQHNVKEENMLYPMTEQALGDGWAAIAPRLDAIYRPSRGV